MKIYVNGEDVSLNPNSVTELDIDTLDFKTYTHTFTVNLNSERHKRELDKAINKLYSNLKIRFNGKTKRK